MSQNFLAHGYQRAGIGKCSLQEIGENSEARAHVSHDFGLWEEDLLNGCRQIADVQYRRSVRSHEERRLLYGIVPNAEDQVCLFDSLMNVITRRERRGSHVEPGFAGDRALAHLGIEEWDLYAAHKIR
jgi:hypothetical protein